jgi:hypothetical protein
MISIDKLIFRIYENPILANISKSAIIANVATVLRLIGVPGYFTEKRVELKVIGFKVRIPSDLRTVKSVTLLDNENKTYKRLVVSQDDRIKFTDKLTDLSKSTLQYKHIEDYIHTSFESGTIELIYTGMNMDENGSPLIPDDESLLLAIENYVKVRYFTHAVEAGLMPASVLERAEVQYSWYLGQATSSRLIPNPEETESLFNSIISLIPKREGHEAGFKYEGLPEKLKRH